MRAAEGPQRDGGGEARQQRPVELAPAGPRQVDGQQRGWFAAATGRTGPADDAALARVRDLRAVTIRLADAHLAGAAAAPGEVRAVHSPWAAALAEAQLPDRLPLTPSAPGLVPHLVLVAVELLQRPDRTGLRRCDGDGCGWLFLDTTRNHSRRWCDAADCGNRARVRAYSRRRREAGG
ncbi:CGNR zinc finger domain-containing protein [Dactylosporangium sp. CS-033363]|uniref:CGNR zinc finger domain-containing protein n=1 Tax=Dactylosporangium sp. CS-033363 TaxID=3239935 RepID=UPI003D8D1762